jgi:hypothetical protein
VFKAGFARAQENFEEMEELGEGTESRAGLMASHITLCSKSDQRVKPCRMRLWAHPGSGPGVIAGHGRSF